eukprot:gene26640-39197_t
MAAQQQPSNGAGEATPTISPRRRLDPSDFTAQETWDRHCASDPRHQRPAAPAGRVVHSDHGWSDHVAAA